MPMQEAGPASLWVGECVCWAQNPRDSFLGGGAVSEWRLSKLVA